MSRQSRTPAELGFDDDAMLSLAVSVARVAAYQLAAQERGAAVETLAKTESPVGLLGRERFERLALFTLQNFGECHVNGYTDASGPVVPVEELSRLGAMMLGQYLANEDA